MLPENVAEICQEFLRLGQPELEHMVTCQDPSTISQPFQHILKYQIPSLQTGRPLNMVMIVLMGKIGSGKSTTINKLFGDNFLCETSSATAATHEIMEHTKELDVGNETCPLKSKLSFIDVPGTHDDDQSRRPANLAAIKKFREECPILKSCPVEISNLPFKIRDAIYPNLVLLTVDATDNRMTGPNSDFRQCLQILKATDLVDTSKINLVVAVTHAMSLGIRKSIYIEETTVIKEQIAEVLQNELGIYDIRIVFIENFPEKFVDRDEGVEFNPLPNGELSHHNLFEAIRDQFRSNGDDFGLLLTSLYFRSDAPEKRQKAESKQMLFEAVNHEKDLQYHQEAEQRLRDIASHTCLYIFFYLGFGYCPVSERAKWIPVYKFQIKKTIKEIRNQSYSFPTCVEVTEEDKALFSTMSFETKNDYQKNRMKNYGLDEAMDLKLATCVERFGKWKKELKEKVNRTIFTFVLEFRLAKVNLSKQTEETLDQQLKTDIQELPDYTEENCSKFYNFFQKWGSHFVHEVWIGGSVLVDCIVDTNNYGNTDTQIWNNFFLSKFSSFGVEFDGDIQIEHIILPPRLSENYDIEMHFHGGNFPRNVLNPITKLDGLTEAIFVAWRQSIESNPVDLERTIKLSPYYQFASSDNKKNSLKAATVEYMNNKMYHRLSPKINDVAARGVAEAVAIKPQRGCTIL